MRNPLLAVVLVGLSLCLILTLCVALAALPCGYLALRTHRPIPTEAAPPRLDGAAPPRADGAAPPRADEAARPPSTQARPTPTRSTTTTDTEAALLAAQVPASDPYDLARRLKHRTVEAATPAAPTQFSTGDQQCFWVLDLDPVASFQVTATLRYVSPHVYVWAENGLEIPDTALEQSAWIFDGQLSPTVRRHFGSEWSPGLDNDVRLTILNARFSGATGYFSSSDEYLKAVMPYSNQREMFYINPDQAEPGTAAYEATLAHEFQHMVHWHTDPNEDAWVNEGCSELAMYLCGYPRTERIAAFARRPDTQLTQWDAQADDIAAHYGAAFLFFAYVAQRFGPELTRDLVANPLHGVAGVDAVLQAHGLSLSFDDLFADWVVANYLSRDDSAAAARYAYRDFDVRAKAKRAVTVYPATGDGTVHQYAADYIELGPSVQDLSLDFAGDVTTTLTPNQAHSGRYQWWSNRGDNSDMTLTRAFDLRGVKSATLETWLWYDIEQGWDYAYIEASTDGGATWQILRGQYTTTDNPSGASYGPGYTGVSGSVEGAPGNAEWVHEHVDLSPVAGRRALIRFEYLTDDAVNRAGLCIDDISIPELGYAYDAELGDGGWVAQGFVRCDNILPQRYSVQVIRLGDQVTVQPVALGPDQSGTLTLPAFAGTQRAVLVISAVTPGSAEVANYHYELRPIK